jgi:hypothetical protein
MPKFMKSNIFAILFIASLAVSCKKNKDDVTPKSTIELLTAEGSKTWKVKQALAKQGDLEVNIIASQNPCITDNLIKLFSDFTYEFSEGATKCNPTDPDLILKANWTLSVDEKSMSIDRFIFLGRTINNPVFILSDVTENSFSGTTSITVEQETFNVLVTFEKVN